MKYCILYVDDESDNLTAFQAVFRRQFQVLVAQGGQEALALLEQENVDLIISDQRMPGMTGVELLEQVKERYPDVIRMVLTGYSDMQAIVDAINKGNVYHYVTKPWNAVELKLILDKALETYSLRLRMRELEKQNILSQFEVLKNQINPHFLFNSMNTLSALISVDPKKAIHFTNQFSRLYRSMLELREQMVISLEEEFNFLKTYLNLQQMRFDENLILEIQMPDDAGQYSLPPFTLQFLVENALKHNIVSNTYPLTIRLYQEKDCLVVANNLQRRGSVEDSTGTGLKNLKARYQLLGIEHFEIIEENDWFIVKAPLIENA